MLIIFLGLFAAAAGPNNDVDVLNDEACLFAASQINFTSDKMDQAYCLKKDNEAYAYNGREIFKLNAEDPRVKDNDKPDCNLKELHHESIWQHKKYVEQLTGGGGSNAPKKIHELILAFSNKSLYAIHNDMKKKKDLKPLQQQVALNCVKSNVKMHTDHGDKPAKEIFGTIIKDANIKGAAIPREQVGAKN